MLDVLVQSRRDKRAAKRLLRKLLKKQGRPPRVRVTDKLASYPAAKKELMPGVEHRRHKGLNNRAERCYGASGADQAPSPPEASTERPMPQRNDLSRSDTPLEQQSTLIAVVEMSQSSWLVAGIVPGLERHPLKKLAPDEEVTRPLS